MASDDLLRRDLGLAGGPGGIRPEHHATQDATRERLQKVIDEAVRGACSCAECAGYLASALRDAGWVDPEEAAQRQKFVERLKQLLEHAEAIVAERDALLPVAEAAKAWAAAVHAASAAGILTPGRSAGDASDAARDAGDRLAAAVDAWESRKETTGGLAR